MAKSTGVRVEEHFLQQWEKRTLRKLAINMPYWVTSDQLTWLGFVGAVLCGVGFALSQLTLHWLWLSIGGLIINWFGDSLDGTLARVRNRQRPTYGFYIDHSLDAITICIMCIGAGMSPMFMFGIAMIVLAEYLVLSIYTYIGTILKDEFKLAYGGLGPTEFRLIIIVFCLVAMYVPWEHIDLYIAGLNFGLFDCVGVGMIAILFVLIITQLVGDLKYFAKKDPVKPFGPNDKIELK